MSVPISVKIIKLRQYIDDHLKDDDGDWEYGHLPYLTKEVNGFAEEDDKYLDSVIWNWPEAVRFSLADLILYSSYRSHRQHYYYIRIFLLSTEEEKTDYLAENLPGCFPESTLHLWPDNFVTGCLKKIRMINVRRNMRGEQSTYEGLLKKLTDELFARGIENGS